MGVSQRKKKITAKLTKATENSTKSTITRKSSTIKSSRPPSRVSIVKIVEKEVVAKPLLLSGLRCVLYLSKDDERYEKYSNILIELGALILEDICQYIEILFCPSDIDLSSNICRCADLLEIKIVKLEWIERTKTSNRRKNIFDYLFKRPMNSISSRIDSSSLLSSLSSRRGENDACKKCNNKCAYCNNKISKNNDLYIPGFKVIKKIVNKKPELNKFRRSGRISELCSDDDDEDSDSDMEEYLLKPPLGESLEEIQNIDVNIDLPILLVPEWPPKGELGDISKYQGLRWDNIDVQDEKVNETVSYFI
jgi:hypothetical protein